MLKLHKIIHINKKSSLVLKSIKLLAHREHSLTLYSYFLSLFVYSKMILTKLLIRNFVKLVSKLSNTLRCYNKAGRVVSISDTIVVVRAKRSGKRTIVIVTATIEPREVRAS